MGDNAKFSFSNPPEGLDERPAAASPLSPEKLGIIFQAIGQDEASRQVNMSILALLLGLNVTGQRLVRAVHFIRTAVDFLQRNERVEVLTKVLEGAEGGREAFLSALSRRHTDEERLELFLDNLRALRAALAPSAIAALDRWVDAIDAEKARSGGEGPEGEAK